MLIETLRICVNVLAVRSFKQIFKFEFVLMLSFCIYSDLAYFPFFQLNQLIWSLFAYGKVKMQNILKTSL